MAHSTLICSTTPLLFNTKIIFTFLDVSSHLRRLISYKANYWKTKTNLSLTLVRLKDLKVVSPHRVWKATASLSWIEYRCQEPTWDRLKEYQIMTCSNTWKKIYQLISMFYLHKSLVIRQKNCTKTKKNSSTINSFWFKNTSKAQDSQVLAYSNWTVLMSQFTLIFLLTTQCKRSKKNS